MAVPTYQLCVDLKDVEAAKKIYYAKYVRKDAASVGCKSDYDKATMEKHAETPYTLWLTAQDGKDIIAVYAVKDMKAEVCNRPPPYDQYSYQILGLALDERYDQAALYWNMMIAVCELLPWGKGDLWWGYMPAGAPVQFTVDSPFGASAAESQSEAGTMIMRGQHPYLLPSHTDVALI